MEDFFGDLRLTFRQLRRSPFFSVTVIGTLALAVGATAAMSGVLRATLLNPLPYPQAGSLVDMGDENLRGFKTSGLMSVLRADDLSHLTLRGEPVFASLGYFYWDDSTLAIAGGSAIRVPAAAVSGGFFKTIGMAAQMGRTLEAGDDVPNGPQTIVISDRLWRSAFASDPKILGRSVRLGSAGGVVVGVMPAAFRLPTGVDLWHPGHIFPSSFGSYRADGSRFVHVFGRLAPTVSLGSARVAADQLAVRLAAAYPESDAAWGFKVTDLRSSLFGEYRHALLLLVSAVVLVLLVAAVNLAGLQLSRNTARETEFAVRVALGVTRARMLRQLVTESLVGVLLGSLAGVTLAGLFLHVLDARLPAALLLLERPHLDFEVLGLAVAVGLGVGLFTAAIPALKLTRSLSAPGSRGVVGRARMIGRTFTVLQIALSLVLLTLSTFVLSDLYRLLTTPLGFDTARTHTFTVDLPWAGDMAKNHLFYTQVENRFAALPGVESVGSISALPLSGLSVRRTFDLAGQAPTPQHDTVVAEGRTISAGYLRTLHIPLVAGRALTAEEASRDRPPVVLINQSLAERYFRDRSPLGQHLVYPGERGAVVDAGEIIGVLGDVRGTGGELDAPVQPEVYSPEDGGWPHMEFALRSDARDAATGPGFESSIRAVVTSLRPDASPGHFTTLSTTLHRSLVQPRLNAALLSGFAAVSLLLVVIGVYGLVAFDVARRTRELGLRMALGASRGGVLRLVMSESARILAAGLALGLLGSWVASRLLSAAVHGGGASTTLLVLVTTAVLSAAVLLATLVPARRAAMVDPMDALRRE